MSTEQKISNLTLTPLESDTEFYIQYYFNNINICGKTTLDSLSNEISARIPFPNLSDPNIVTYNNLNLNGDIGQSSDTIAAGDDNRFLTLDEKEAVNASSSPSSINPLITYDNITPTISGEMIYIQGSIPAAGGNTISFIDSTMVAETVNPGTWNGTIYSSTLNGGSGGTTNNWSDILPIEIPLGIKRTFIIGEGYLTIGSSNNIENFGVISILIDWENNRVHGYVMTCYGTGMHHQACMIFTGTTNSEIYGIMQNGYYTAISDSVIQTTTNSITKLPLPSAVKNIEYTIEHRAF